MASEDIFCPACSTRLQEVEWEDSLTIQQCPSCGRKAYRNSKPCVVAIALDRENRKILLTKRGVQPFKGYWDMPGGFLRDGEDPAEGLRREVAEELGVDCVIEKLFDILVDTYGEFDVYTFNVCYIVSLLSDAMTPMDDVAEIKWFYVDDLPENMAFRFLPDLIKKVCKAYNI